MLNDDVGTTNPSELMRVGDPRNHPAWLEFQKRYDPILRRCCKRLELDSASADDVCQETWLEVAKRMRSFVYDPRGSFRAWLWKVCYHEGIDYLQRRTREHMFSLDSRDEPHGNWKNASWFQEAVDEKLDGGFGRDDHENRSLASLFRAAEEIQEAVRRRVQPHTWEAFWLVGIDLWTVEETARYLDMNNDAVFKAKLRTAKKLQAAGRTFIERKIEAESTDRSNG